MTLSNVSENLVKSNMIPMNLQLFAEEGIESSVNAEPVVNVEPQETNIEPAGSNTTEPVNAENEEVATPIVEEKPVQSAEENAKYAAIRREAEQKAASKARDEMIADMYGESHGIYTYADYQKAVEAQKEEQKLQELLKNNIPEDIAKEFLESKKFREQYETEKKAMAEREAKDNDFKSFLDTFPDVKADEIPAEVWEENANGKSLVDAYTKYENKLLKQKLAEFEKGTTAKQVNEKNAINTPGSVTGNGQVTNDYFSKEQVDKMSEKEVLKHYDSIMESMKKWK